MASTVTAPIVEWKREKGYGFLQLGSQRIFLHQRNLVRRLKTPEVGDVLRFRMGTDELGRAFARDAVYVSDAFGWRNLDRHGSAGWRGKIPFQYLVVLAVLLVLPVWALHRLPVDALWFELYLMAISALTFFVYACDKRQAGLREWRVSEFTLHFMEVIGGWPGAFLAQRWLRHKTAKRSYQVVFWLIIAAYQLAAADYLLEGRLRYVAVRWIPVLAGPEK